MNLGNNLNVDLTEEFMYIIQLAPVVVLSAPWTPPPAQPPPVLVVNASALAMSRLPQSPVSVSSSNHLQNISSKLVLVQYNHR